MDNHEMDEQLRQILALSDSLDETLLSHVANSQHADSERSRITASMYDIAMEYAHSLLALVSIGVGGGEKILNRARLMEGEICQGRVNAPLGRVATGRICRSAVRRSVARLHDHSGNSGVGRCAVPKPSRPR